MRLTPNPSREQPKKPAARTYKCLNCGLELQADESAPKNIYSRRFCSDDCRTSYMTPLQ